MTINKFDEISDVVRLNLSHYAWNILNSDKDAFTDNDREILKLSNLMNTLIQNNFTESPANLQNNLDKHITQITNFFKNPSNSNSFICDYDFSLKNLQETENNLLTFYKIMLFEDLSKTQESGNIFNLRLQNNTKKLLDNLDICNRDNLNYKIYGNTNGKPKLSKMLKNFFEIYSQMPFYQREQIFRKSLVTTIVSAISQKNALIISLTNGTKFDVIPYKIVTNTASTYNYLVGLSKLSGSNNSFIIGCFRLTRIKKTNTNPRETRTLLDSDIENIEKEIRKKSVEFISRDMEYAKIKLTAFGFKQYCSRIHLRPAYFQKTRLDDGSYELIFDSPTDQLRFYFFSFGADAEVIEPRHLREEFRQMYETAAQKYCT